MEHKHHRSVRRKPHRQLEHGEVHTTSMRQVARHLDQEAQGKGLPTGPQEGKEAPAPDKDHQQDQEAQAEVSLLDHRKDPEVLAEGLHMGHQAMALPEVRLHRRLEETAQAPCGRCT